MKLFKRLTIILVFILSLCLLCACETTGTNKAPAPTNLRYDETKVFWDSPEENEDLSFEISYTLDGKTYSKIVIGTSYNFKNIEVETLTFTLQTLPYGNYNAPSELIEGVYELHLHEYIDGVCECGKEDPNYQPPHVHEFVEGKCECGEEDPNYEPPHVHEFVEGKCECGEEDPNYEPPHVHEFVEGKCECGEEDPSYVPEDDDDVSEEGYVIKVKTDVAYILKMNHENLGRELYITGNMNGYYYETTSILAESIVIYLEETNGGYYVYHLKGSTKVYLDIVPSGTHINVVYVNTPGDPWTFNETVNTITNPVNGTEYMLGTDSNKTYQTYSANKLSYATTTFIAYLYKAEDLNNNVDKPVIPDRPPVDPGDLDISNETYYQSVLGLSGSALKSALRTLITTTHTKKTTYADCKTYLPSTDEDPNNPNNMILFYTGQSIKKSTDLNNDWNREHLWPQSLGWFKTSGAGADLHHIRPCNISVNSSRGNKKYGESSGYYVPTDEYKGDIARIIFYLMVRYPESDSYSFSSVCEGVDVLLAWNELDPVSELEILRNDKIAKIQGNRNPFIDCADFADLIW